MAERYEPADINYVVEYARQRGVRTVVEIDSPGHTSSWCYAHPDICPNTTDFCYAPLNPALNSTFNYISDILNDCTGGVTGGGLFPDNFIHLGGDEVDTTCWSENPSIAAWMAQNNYTTSDAYAYFVGKVQNMAFTDGREVINWEEVYELFYTELNPNVVVYNWYNTDIAPNATANGYRVLWSIDGYWYLDGTGVSWQLMYGAEPCEKIPPATCEQLMLGGGGCMWGEYVDESDFQNTIWPRMAAIAERLWSPVTIRDVDQAHPRYSSFRCLLNQRGIGAAPSNNEYARSQPVGPGACQNQ